MTKVAVGLPIYNGEKYLDQALRTLVEQTHRDLEIIISDNASTDGTQAICEAYAAVDDRIRYVRQPENIGAAANHNFVAEQATAPYFRWYAADDWLAPQCIEQCARTLDEEPAVVLAWPRPTGVDADGHVIADVATGLKFDNATPSSRLRSRLGRGYDDRGRGWCVPVYGVARRQAFLAALPLQAYQASDQAILVRLALLGPWRELPEGLFYCRQHDENSTQATPAHEVARWMDPRAIPNRSLPFCRRYIDFIRAVLNADIPLSEKMRCVPTLLQWPLTYNHWRLMRGDIRIYVRDCCQSLLGRFRPSPTVD